MTYPTEVREAILERIAGGESLNRICSDDGMPSLMSFMRWVDADSELRDRYARAMVLRAEVKFAELDEVSEDAANADSAVRVAGLRLKADNIKWQLGKMSPKKYGDKIDLNHSGEVKYTKIERVIVGNTDAQDAKGT